jgi:hypothetical protein
VETNCPIQGHLSTVIVRNTILVRVLAAREYNAALRMNFKGTKCQNDEICNVLDTHCCEIERFSSEVVSRTLLCVIRMEAIFICFFKDTISSTIRNLHKSLGNLHSYIGYAGCVGGR